MTYEYACEACGHQWEAEQSISEAPLKKCPKCKKAKAKRQISGGAGFILKGGGWYADGYGSSKGASGSSSSSTSDASAKSDSTKSESKSESKSDSGDSKPSGGGESSPKKPSGKKTQAA